MEEIRFAVIGCGLMGGRHAETLTRTPGMRCVALHDQNTIAAEALGQKLRIETIDNYDALLARKEIDGVVICLPSFLHAHYGISAARAGKHVICEKPIDIRIDRAEELIEACERQGVLLTVISQNRFTEGAMALKRAVDGDMLGKLLLANASIKCYHDDAYYAGSDWRGRFGGEGGGVFMSQGIHYTDLLLWFLGETAEAHSLLMTSRSIIETEDVGAILLRSESGAIATITATTSAYPGFPERIELHGKTGSAVLEQGRIVYWKQMGGTEPPAVAFEPPTPEDLDARLIPFQRQYRDFLAALETGGRPLVTPRQALSVVKTILNAYANRF
ncbi:MAG: Gfo/Idh/MocA family oxidoreductase [Candidatus Sumerlaeia bacterium]